MKCQSHSLVLCWMSNLIVKTATEDELAGQRLKLSEEKKLVKTGYHRVKEKVKALRQDYRKAVTEGRRSGTGKLVCDNWNRLKLLWG